MEIEEGFEAALGNFGLVRGVGAVPTWVLEDGATEDGWGDGAVVSDAEERAEGAVLGEGFFEVGEGALFGAGGRKVGGVGGG